MSNTTITRTKLTVRHVKINNQLSQGSLNFSALVYFEDKLIGSAECHGRGDGTVFRESAALYQRGKWKQLEIDAQALKDAHDYVVANPIPDGIEGPFEDHVDQAIELFQMEADLVRKLKTKCLFIHDGKLRQFSGKLSTHSEARNAELSLYERRLQTSHPGAQILNRMEHQEALNLWIKSAT